jgi:hypothetical protein
MVDPKAPLPGDRLRQWRDGLFVEVFDGPAGRADEVVVMSRLAPHIRRDVTRALEPPTRR